jgi:gamma-glutamylcyclotransferase (GGCT)/AIG2-like uncharacterized protein YtfP
MDLALFAYGTLCLPEVFRRASGMALASEAAVLPGHRRAYLEGVHYPGIVTDLACEVDGRLYTGLTERALAALDAFEGKEYERVTRTVRAARGDVAAEVYVLHPSRAHLLTDRPWDLETFRATELGLFLKGERALPAE